MNILVGITNYPKVESFVCHSFVLLIFDFAIILMINLIESIPPLASFLELFADKLNHLLLVMFGVIVIG